MKIQFWDRAVDISKSLKSVNDNVGKLTVRIYTSFISVWDEYFRMSLRPKRIQKVINSYTAIAIMPVSEQMTTKQMLDDFEHRYTEFQKAVTVDSQRGGSFALAWCTTDPEEGPSVHAMVMNHPFQEKASMTMLSAIQREI